MASLILVWHYWSATKRPVLFACRNLAAPIRIEASKIFIMVPISLDRARQYHLVKGGRPDFDAWRAWVFGAGVCWAFEAVAVYVEAFDDARVAAVAAGRVGALEDFSDRLGAGEGKP